MEALLSERAVDLVQAIHQKIEGTRHPVNVRYPERFMEIIRIFREIRDGIIKVKADGDKVILEVEADFTLPDPELRLKITRDTRSIIARVFGKGKLETNIFIFTSSGYRTATEETLSSHRYFDPTLKSPRLRESPYTVQSYTNLSTMINKFHDLLAKSSRIQLHAARTI